MNLERRAEALDALVWEAFRYVAGEMEAGEQQAFELRLAVDEAACSAVAEVVELVGAIGLVVPSLEATKRMASRAYRVPHAARAAIAASVLLAVLGGLIVAGWPRGRDGEGSTLALGSAALEAWSVLGGDSEAGGSWPLVNDPDLTPVDELSAPDEAPADAVPSWMIEVVSLEPAPDALGERPQEN